MQLAVLQQELGQDKRASGHKEGVGFIR